MIFDFTKRRIKKEIRSLERVLASKRSIIEGKLMFAYLPTQMTNGQWVWLKKYREHPAGYFITGRGTVDRMIVPFLKTIEAYRVYRTASTGNVTFSDLEMVCDHQVPRDEIVKTINAIMSSTSKTEQGLLELKNTLESLNH